MNDLTSQRTEWQKSSHSTQDPTECVEVSAHVNGQDIAARDSIDPSGPMLRFSGAEWRTFLNRVKTGALDLP
jgi:hypothetical protein